MKVVVIDGQGGKLGKLVIETIVKKNMDVDLYAIGTNTMATSAMLKGGAAYGATGENSVVVASRDADVIIGPIGIISADSLLGEITPNMAVAVGQSRAVKLLIPVGNCNNQVIGVSQLSMNDMAIKAAEKLMEIIDSGVCR